MQRRIKGRTAEELVGDRLERIANIKEREEREAAVTDLIMGLTEALALIATTHLKHTPDQPRDFGKHCGDYIMECMNNMRTMLNTKGLLRNETNTDQKADDPWS